MKCLIKSLLGQDSYEQENQKGGDICTPMPPIVKSIIGSIFFILLMVVVSNMIQI